MQKNLATNSSGFAILGLFVLFIFLLIGVVLFSGFQKGVQTKSSSVLAAQAGYALQFNGNGVNDIDRVKIRIDNPETKADIGSGDFTIEWWMNASLANNDGQANCGSGSGWITGNIIFDRDIFGGGDYGDYGISLSNGRIAFGVHNGSSDTTLCGSRNIADNSWHHVAITRRQNGEMRIWIDGTLDTSLSGPSGNISYRNGRGTSYPNSDPFLVIGAEKHDAGSAYPSYNGLLDEVRVSNSIRYASSFTRPSEPFISDANSVLLYHFDEGTGTSVIDSSSNPLNGVIRVGGNPTGPLYVTSTAPLGGAIPSSTPVATPAPTGTPISSLPGLLAAYAFEENTGTIVSDSSGNNKTLSLTGNPVWSSGRYGRGLNFDGINDNGSNSSFNLPSQFTYMAWVNNPSNQGYETIATVGQNRDFYIENGSMSFYDNSERNFGNIPSGSWQHLSITYNGTQLRAYLNGQPLGSAQSVSLASITDVLQIGRWGSNADFLSASLDEVRIYNRALTQSEIESAMNTPLAGQPAPTSTPVPTPVPTLAPTPTPTLVPATPTPVSTPSSGNLSLSFDGSNDRAATGVFTSVGTKTVEAWIFPTSSAQNSIIMGNYNGSNGWSLELEEGRLSFWAGNNGSWRSVSGTNTLLANNWYHVAATFNANTGSTRVYINGSQVGSGSLSGIGAVSAFSVGGSSGLPYFRGQIDEIRISSTERYNANFVRPNQAFNPDPSTVSLYHFNEGSNAQQVNDSSGNNYYIFRGGASSAQSSDPAWVNSTAPF